MKFTDGFWLTRPGVTLEWAVRAQHVRTEHLPTGEQVLRLDAPVHGGRHRGDTLNHAVLEVEVFSPAEGVIGVRSTHHAGAGPTRPAFALSPADVDIAVTEHPERTRLTSGDLTVSASTGDQWRLEFTGPDGRVLTVSDGHGLGRAVVPRQAGVPEQAGEPGREYQVGRLSLGIGTLVYGMGERFTPLVRNGQVVDVWQADGGTSSEQAYKNVPFYLTNSGYGVFVNDPGLVSFEVGSESVAQVQFSVPGQHLEYLVIYGPTPKEILRRYTALTGRPARPPAWSFGLWLSTSFLTDYDEATVTGFVQQMAAEQIPLSVFHFDCYWMREYRWCDFTWDPEVFGDPSAMLARLHERGLHVCVWINPYIGRASPLFAEGMAAGYLLHRPDGTVWQSDHWQPGMAIVDFTHPGARAWFASYLERLLDQGVDAFKTDFGERIPTDVAWHDGSDPERMHNYYAQLYNACVFDVLQRRRGTGEAVVFARAATAGGQQFGVHWGGDNTSSLPSMAETLRGGLSLGLSGFGFWSHDIGGFEGTPDPTVFTRWLAFGLLSSHSRLHGSGSYRVPWAFGAEAVRVAREYAALKLALMPYLYAAAVTAHEHGIPVLRAMLLEFPDDPATHYLDRQYLLGPDLLVAPVFGDDGSVEFYVPAGAWVDLRTGAVRTGPGWHRERHAVDSLPLLLRPGSVLALGARDDRPDYDYADGVTLLITGPVDGAPVETVIPGTDGRVAARFRSVRSGRTLTVTRVIGEPHPWSVVLTGGRTVASVRGGTQAEHRLGIQVEADGDEIELTVAP